MKNQTSHEILTREYLNYILGSVEYDQPEAGSEADECLTEAFELLRTDYDMYVDGSGQLRLLDA